MGFGGFQKGTYWERYRRTWKRDEVKKIKISDFVYRQATIEEREPCVLLPAHGEQGGLWKERWAEKARECGKRVAVSCRGVLLFHVPLRNKRESASSGSSMAKAPFGVYLKIMQALKSSSLAPALWQQQKRIISEKRYTTETHAII